MISLRTRATDPKVDSREGMEMLMEFARTGPFVLQQWHKKLANKHGVDTTGVIFASDLPPNGN